MTAPQNPRVTQADRDRAADYHRLCGSPAGAVSFILSEHSTLDSLVQAFARHREAADAASKAREAALVEALRNLIAACDEGRTVPRGGACGMTIEAQIRASVINGVPAWPVEEARDVLDRAALTKEPDA